MVVKKGDIIKYYDHYYTVLSKPAQLTLNKRIRQFLAEDEDGTEYFFNLYKNKGQWFVKRDQFPANFYLSFFIDK